LPDRIQENDKSEFINRQLQHYHHIRDQSLGVLRLLIALASIFILSLTTDTVQNYIQNFSFIPQYLQNNPDPSFDILISFLGILLIFPAIVVSAFAFVFGLMSIIQIFFVNSLRPGLGDQNQLVIPNYGNSSWSSNYIIWINENSTLLDKIERGLKYGILLLGVCFLYLFIAAISLISVHNQTTTFLLIINGTYILFTIASILYASLYVLRKYIDSKQNSPNSILLLFDIIFGVDEDEITSLIHTFIIIMIIIQAFCSTMMIWLIYGWWQLV
jgi:hypothetical protein